MKNLHHVNLIEKKFLYDKKMQLIELGKVQKLLASKRNSVQKLTIYQHEYTNNEHFKLTYAIPALSKNMNAFSQKLSSLIEKEDNEIKQLEGRQKEMMDKLLLLEHKLKMMEKFKEKMISAQTELEEKIIQHAVDDLVALTTYFKR